MLVKKTILLAQLVLVVFASNAVAQSSSENVQKQSLKNIPGFSVLVENLPPELENSVLNRASIQTDVELRLRRAGITVRDRAENTSAGFPYLYINVNIKEADSGLYALSIDVELRQNVIPVSNTDMVLPTSTWTESVLATVGSNNLRQIRAVILDYVDRFINDYLAARDENE